MTFSTRNFDPLTPLAPKFPNFATQIWLFRLKHTVAVVTHAHVLQNFYKICLGYGVLLAKTTFSTKIGGGLGQGSVQKNLGPPTYFCNRWSQQLSISYTTWFGEPPKFRDPYDGDATIRCDTVYVACSQKLAGSQRCLLHAIKQEI